MNSICFNGKIISDLQPVFLASNRGYRYGDGLFETIKVQNKKLLLSSFHFERLFAGLTLMQFSIPPLFTEKKIEEEILRLCSKNNCDQLARVRFSLFRGNGGLYDPDQSLQYLIECWPLQESVNTLNENGLVIDVFRDAAKSCDQFSNLKSANFLCYSQAALFAKENKLNDCLVLNTAGYIADSTIANLFIIKDGNLSTPGLDQGCIGGVMRRHLLTDLPKAGISVKEASISVEDILTADEVFLTNAIRGIRWVRQFQDSVYSNVMTTDIYSRLQKTIPS